MSLPKGFEGLLASMLQALRPGMTPEPRLSRLRHFLESVNIRFVLSVKLDICLCVSYLNNMLYIFQKPILKVYDLGQRALDLLLESCAEAMRHMHKPLQMGVSKMSSSGQ